MLRPCRAASASSTCPNSLLFLFVLAELSFRGPLVASGQRNFRGLDHLSCILHKDHMDLSDKLVHKSDNWTVLQLCDRSNRLSQVLLFLYIAQCKASSSAFLIS